MKQHPPGLLEQREAFSAKGRYGKWVRLHPAVFDKGGIIFLHGGISPALISMNVAGINAEVRSEFKQFDDTRQTLTSDNIFLPFFTLQEALAVAQAELIVERKTRPPSDEASQAKITKFLEYTSWLCVREDGPLWFRGYDTWSDADGLTQIGKILEAYNATNIVVGHTVQRTAHIRSRFGGRVMLIDTGMLSSYYPGGKPSALEIGDDGKITALYLDEQFVLRDGRSIQPVSSPAQKKDQ